MSATARWWTCRSKPGKITALVSGSELYTVKIDIAPLAARSGKHQGPLRGQVGSLVELLQGKLSKSVIEIVTAHEGGLFPSRVRSRFMLLPDWAGMCKHVAAVMYGVGARLDHPAGAVLPAAQVDHLN